MDHACDLKPFLNSMGFGGQFGAIQKNTLWLFNIAMEVMAHRNRWFTVLNSVVDLSMANCNK
jgi:hypothetical protein